MKKCIYCKRPYGAPAPKRRGITLCDSFVHLTIFKENNAPSRQEMMYSLIDSS